MTTFKNPYAHLSTSETAQAVIRYPKGDSQFLKLIRPQTGTITGVLGLLLQKLCHELRTREITDVSKCAEFEHFIANCVITDGRGLRQRTAGGTSPKRQRVVRRRDTTARDKPAPDEAVVPNLQGDNGVVGEGKTKEE